MPLVVINNNCWRRTTRIARYNPCCQSFISCTSRPTACWHQRHSRTNPLSPQPNGEEKTLKDGRDEGTTTSKKMLSDHHSPIPVSWFNLTIESSRPIGENAQAQDERWPGRYAWMQLLCQKDGNVRHTWIRDWVWRIAKSCLLKRPMEPSYPEPKKGVTQQIQDPRWHPRSQTPESMCASCTNGEGY